jgi:hypothetical protein
VKHVNISLDIFLLFSIINIENKRKEIEKMKITDRCPNTVKTFGKLETGDVFRDDDDDIMMKIKPYPGEETNCISLKDGEGYIYDENREIIPIADVELIIK